MLIKGYSILECILFLNIPKYNFYNTRKVNMIKFSMNNSLKMAAIGACSLFASNSFAIAIQGVGTYAGVSNYSNCPSFCYGSSGSYDSNGDEGQVESFASLSNESGVGKAYSSFVSGSYMPLLRVETSAIDRASTGATAFSVQNFTNTGTETKTVDLNVNLHGSVSSNDPVHSSNYLSASIAIISGTSLEWYPSFGTLVYEVAQPLFNPLSLYIGDGLDVNDFDTISFDINAGESFFIVSNMQANADNGYANAWNTLSMNFTDSSNLQAALQVAGPSTPVSVPEPKTVFLFALCLAGLLLRKRSV